MDAVALVMIFGPLAAAIVVALGPGWKLYNEPEPIPLRVHHPKAGAGRVAERHGPVEIHARRVG